MASGKWQVASGKQAHEERKMFCVRIFHLLPSPWFVSFKGKKKKKVLIFTFDIKYFSK
jgi:hypothetical protein